MPVRGVAGKVRADTKMTAARDQDVQAPRGQDVQAPRAVA